MGCRFFKLTTVLLLVFLTTLITGCQGKKEPQQKPDSQEKIKIGVSLASMEFDGNVMIKKVMDERAKKEKVKITWLDAKMEPSQQEKDIDTLIQQKVQAIILQTVDPLEGGKLVEKITQANIKVIGLETLPFNAPMDGYVAADHTRAGELMAQFVLHQMNGQTEQTQGSQQQPSAKSSFKVLVLKGDPSDPVSELIATAANSTLKQNKNTEKVQVAEHPQGNPLMAQMTVQKALQESTPDAILATDDRLADAAIKVLQKGFLDSKVLTVAVGGDQKITQALSGGEHDAEIDIMPEQLAGFALDAALDLAQKDTWNYDTKIKNGNFDIPSKIIPVRLITREQVHLLEARWDKGGKQEDKKKKPDQQKEQSDSEEQSSGGGENSGQEQGGQGGEQGQEQGKQEKKTKLKIVTQDGKTMEVEVPGEIQKIEQQDGGGSQSQQEGGQGGGGSQ
ncbi:substrate-binding domain-containing protein [Desulforamulus aeronauticus]|uniref:Monosaccharide ABC transporter substrate-binding protein, CUT2 family n=1 Tax=Desulforamulus aeronauticus DSM 10349 TaxID=1121421 RepID=A0A1M6NXW4_9FIRM|nr:substrate-binding domain-containing protein [Desulforamulus aeronauticus]SHK00474.1 monosaccharide ABC transporter substrate-binding protein, CUT2 family [Desulforamulus aeronauticus DSM 10349]